MSVGDTLLPGSSLGGVGSDGSSGGMARGMENVD